MSLKKALCLSLLIGCIASAISGCSSAASEEQSQESTAKQTKAASKKVINTLELSDLSLLANNQKLGAYQTLQNFLDAGYHLSDKTDANLDDTNYKKPSITSSIILVRNDKEDDDSTNLYVDVLTDKEHATPLKDCLVKSIGAYHLTEASGVEFAKGITYGNSPNDVIKAYGMPYHYENTLDYADKPYVSLTYVNNKNAYKCDTYEFTFYDGKLAEGKLTFNYQVQESDKNKSFVTKDIVGFEPNFSLTQYNKMDLEDKFKNGLLFDGVKLDGATTFGSFLDNGWAAGHFSGDGTRPSLIINNSAYGTQAEITGDSDGVNYSQLDKTIKATELYSYANYVLEGTNFKPGTGNMKDILESLGLPDYLSVEKDHISTTYNWNDTSLDFQSLPDGTIRYFKMKWVDD